MSEMTPEMKRFFEQAPTKNEEMFGNLQAMHGMFRATMTSEIANMTLAIKIAHLSGDEFMRQFLTETTSILVGALLFHFNWNRDEFLKDVEMFMGARHQAVKK